MLQCTGLHQEGTLTEWDIVYFWAMKLQAGKPKAVARCDWCNQGLLGQTRRRAPAFPLVNHGTGLYKNNKDTEDKWTCQLMHRIYNNRGWRSWFLKPNKRPKKGGITGLFSLMFLATVEGTTRFYLCCSTLAAPRGSSNGCKCNPLG